MKKSLSLLFIFFFIVALATTLISPYLALGILLVLVAFIFFINDYSRVVYFISAFFIIDYIIRTFLDLAILSSIWDEAFLIGALLLFIIKFFFEQKEKKHILNPIDLPMIIFILINLAVLLVSTTYPEVGIEGFRAVCQNLFWYFIVFSLLKNEKQCNNALFFIVSSMLIVALIGIYQYVTGVEMPASWVDSAETGVSTRAFSIVQSPNILGSIMTLVSMLSLGLFFFKKKLFLKVFYGMSFIIFSLCLLVTLSRGAWLGFGVSILIFVLIKDKRILLPLALIGLLVILFVPAVSQRVFYMLSSDYIVSSLTGGRLLRWQQGWELFKENLLTGVGLGHFGGSVAAHYPNYFPNAFYVDNYFLKIAVESGILGILSFIYLTYSATSTIFKNIFIKKNEPISNILLGIFTGSLGVLVQCLSENIFEVPGMIILFWSIIAIGMALIYKPSSQL